MTTDVLREFWFSLNDNQRVKLKNIASEFTSIDLADKLLKKLFNNDIYSAKISGDCKSFLHSQKFISIEDIKAFGLDNLKDLKGYKSVYEQEIISIC